jgi:hypothetical protein
MAENTTGPSTTANSTGAPVNAPQPPPPAVNPVTQAAVKAGVLTCISRINQVISIPDPVQGKHFSIGLGVGNYHGTSAVAAGLKATIPETNVSIMAGVSRCRGEYTANGGVSLSF